MPTCCCGHTRYGTTPYNSGRTLYDSFSSDNTGSIVQFTFPFSIPRDHVLLWNQFEATFASPFHLLVFTTDLAVLAVVLLDHIFARTLPFTIERSCIGIVFRPLRKVWRCFITIHYKTACFNRFHSLRCNSCRDLGVHRSYMFKILQASLFPEPFTNDTHDDRNARATVSYSAPLFVPVDKLAFPSLLFLLLPAYILVVLGCSKRSTLTFRSPPRSHKIVRHCSQGLRTENSRDYQRTTLPCCTA